MRAAAKNMDFEKAIELRDMIMEIKAEDQVWYNYEYEKESYIDQWVIWSW